MNNPKILISDSPFQEAANHICDLVTESIQKRGRFVVALSGGQTPIELFRLLALRDLPWEKFFVFWCDERNVPKFSPESNYNVAWESWLKHVGIPEKQIFPFKTEMRPPEAVARDYENAIKSVLQTSGDQIPRLDLSLLGLGQDGHTASIFTKEDFGDGSLVKAPWIEKLNSYRYTLSPRLLNKSHNILILVTGPEKSQIVAAILSRNKGETRYPINLIRPTEGNVLWILDEAAATDLKKKPPAQ